MYCKRIYWISGTKSLHCGALTRLFPVQNDFTGSDLKIALEPGISLSGLLSMTTFPTWLAADQQPKAIFSALMGNSNPGNVPANAWVCANQPSARISAFVFKIRFDVVRICCMYVSETTLPHPHGRWELHELLRDITSVILWMCF